MLQKAVLNMSLWDAHSEDYVWQAQLHNLIDPFGDCIIGAKDVVLAAMTSGELAALLIFIGDA